MEVEAVCKKDCRIFIHSEVEVNRQNFSSEEDFEQACFETMLPWEEGNAMHAQATREDCFVKIVNTTSINGIRDKVDWIQENPLNAPNPSEAVKITNKKQLMKLIFKYKTDKTDKKQNIFNTITNFLENVNSEFSNNSSTMIEKNSSLSLEDLRKIFDELDFSNLTDQDQEKKFIMGLHNESLKNFLIDKISEDKLLSEARQFMRDQPDSETMQDLNYQLHHLRQQGKIVNLYSAVKNAVINYEGTDLSAYKKALLRHCPANVKGGIETAIRNLSSQTHVKLLCYKQLSEKQNKSESESTIEARAKRPPSL